MPTEIQMRRQYVYVDLEPEEVAKLIDSASSRGELVWFEAEERGGLGDIYLNPRYITSVYACEVRNAETRKAQWEAMQAEDDLPAEVKTLLSISREKAELLSE